MEGSGKLMGENELLPKREINIMKGCTYSEGLHPLSKTLH